MEPDFAGGAAYLDGRYMPVAQAAVPILDWGYRRSDVTYDVVGVWRGAFFRLDDHIARFRRSMAALRLAPPESDDNIRAVLTQCVRLSGLRDAYVAVDCLRGRPPPCAAYHPANARNYLVAFAIPWVWLIPPDIQARGAHLVIATPQRIPPASVDPTVKNFHWADLTRGMFEARDAGADTCVLLDGEGYVTEGPGFNVFAITDGVAATPDRGALEGITRRSVMELCDEIGLPCRTERITADELRNADEIFIATTAGGIMPASRIDGRIMGNDRPGQITMRLHDLFWRKREQGWHATAIDYAGGDRAAGDTPS